MDREQIQDIISRVSNEYETYEECYRSEDGREVTFYCYIDDDTGRLDCAIYLDGTNEDVKVEQAVKYMSGGIFEEVKPVSGIETGNADVTVDDAGSEIQEQEEIAWEDMEEWTSGTEPGDYYGNGFDTDGTTDEPPDIPAGELSEILENPENADGGTIVEAARDDVINSTVGKILETGVDKTGHMEKYPDGLTREERAELQVSQIKAGFIPFEMREGFSDKNIPAFTSEQVEIIRDSGLPEFGKLLSMDTTQYVTAEKGAIPSEGEIIRSKINVPYGEFKDLLSYNAKENDVFKEENIKSISATKQIGGTVEVDGFRKDGSLVQMSVTNIVTIDVAFKDGSHLEKTMVVDDAGTVRGYFDFAKEQVTADGRYMEIPVKGFETEGSGIILPHIPTFDRTDPDNKVSLTKYLSDGQRVEFVEAFRERCSEFLEQKLDDRSARVEDLKNDILALTDYHRTELDEARADVAKSETILLDAGGKILSGFNFVVEKLEQYNDVVNERKTCSSGRDSDEYKKLLEKEQNARKEFSAAFEKISNEVKNSGIKEKFQLHDKFVEVYNTRLDAYEKQLEGNNDLFGIKEDIGSATSLGETSWQNHLDGGEKINTDRAFAMMCHAEGERSDKAGLLENVLSDSMELTEQKESFDNKYQDIVQDYNASVDNEKDKIHFDKDGLAFSGNGDMIPIEAAQDKHAPVHRDELQLEKPAEYDENGQSVEIKPVSMDESEMDKDDPRAKFLEYIKSGYDRNDIENLRVETFQTKLEQALEIKGDALDREEKDGILKEIRDAFPETENYNDIEKNNPTSRSDVEQENNDTGKNDQTTSDFKNTQAEKFSSADIDKSFKRNFSGTYGRISAEGENGEIKDVRISSDKMNELKIQAAREAKLEVSLNPGMNYEKTRDEILKAKVEHTLEKLKTIQGDLVKMDKALNSIDIHPRLIGQHTGYKMLCNEFDAAVKAYQHAGGATGKDEFVTKGVNGLERFCGMLDVNRTNIIQTLLIDVLSPDVKVGFSEIYGKDSGVKLYSPGNSMFYGMFLGIEKTAAFLPRLFVDAGKNMMEAIKENRVEKVERDFENKLDKDDTEKVEIQNEDDTKNVEIQNEDDAIENEENKKTDAITVESGDGEEPEEIDGKSILDMLCDFFGDLLDGKAGMEEALEKVAGIFASGKVSDEDITEGFKEAVSERKDLDEKTVADIAVEGASLGTGPLDELLDKMADALSSFGEFMDNIFENAADFLEEQFFERDESGTDGIIEFYDNNTFADQDFITDETGQIVHDAGGKVEDIVSDVDAGLTLLDDVASLLREDLTNEGFSSDFIEAAVERGVDDIRMGLENNMELDGVTKLPEDIDAASLIQNYDVDKLVNDVSTEENSDIDTGVEMPEVQDIDPPELMGD